MGVKQRIESFGLRRYGSAKAGYRVVNSCSMLALGLVMLVVLWQGTFVSAPMGIITGAVAGVVVQELVGLVRRRRR